MATNHARGFAAMSPALHRKISAMGGRASHSGGRGRSTGSYGSGRERSRETGRRGGRSRAM